jgi:hypothetical protein
MDLQRFCPFYREAMNTPETGRRPPGNRSRLTCYSSHGAKGTNVNDQILNAIDEEIAKLRQARAILAESAPVRKTPTAAVTHKKPRRKLSAKARKAIADAQRRRWAKVKSQ